MKIKLISRNDSNYTRESKSEALKETYTPDPTLHRFEKPREYIRAINSAKYSKWFARPFVSAVSDHSDTPLQIELSPKEINMILSGSCDGQLILWNIGSKKKIWTERNVFDGFVNGLKINKDGNRFFACGGSDGSGLLKVYNLNTSVPRKTRMISQYKTKSTLLCIDISSDERNIVTGGSKIVVWDSERFVPKKQFSPSFEDSISVAFNKVETSMFAVATNDNRICIFDLKSGSIVQKFEMMRRINDICWNPMRPFNFTVGSDDFNCYTFDFRKLEKGPVLLHSGHTGAVMSVDYSPSGQEFATASFDNTVRIFKVDNTRIQSRDVYHTQRMHKVWKVRYSLDGKFIYSGSDDHSIRVWKSVAKEPLRVVSRFEKKKLDYQNALIDRYSEFSEVRRLKDYHHLPKPLLSKERAMKQELAAFKLKQNKKLNKKDKFRNNQYQRDLVRPFKGTKDEEEIYSDEEDF